ncbi:MAG: TolB family protein, partial [Gemmatimonadaceae bacterium]
AFHRSNRRAVYVINVDGSDERLLVADAWNPAWSPDGQRIAFNAGGEVVGGVFVINVDGSGITRLISSDFVNAGDWIGLPAWSPDGRSVAFVRANYEEPWQVYIVSADGGAPRALFDGNFIPSQSEPSWSPDGTMLAIESFSGIARVRAGVAELLVHGTAGRAFDPDWSPDGRSLVFHRFSGPPETDSPFGSRMRIYIANVDGGPVRQLVPEAIAPALPNYWDHEVAWLRGSR